MIRRSNRVNGTSGANPLPPMDVLHREFEADFFRGLLFWKEPIKYPRKVGPLGNVSGRRGHLAVEYKGQKLKVHRVIYAMYHGNDPGDLVIDHINHDPTDNRIDNLRACSLADNSRNRSGGHARNTSGFRGVYWRSRGNSWAATVPLGNGKKKAKAGFRCPTAAAVWAHKQRAELLGEYAGSY